MTHVRRVLATLVATLSLIGLNLVAIPAVAHASACNLPPCGSVYNRSGQSIQIRYKNSDTGPWIQETLPNGQIRGGWTYDQVDVDQVYVPLGCIGNVNVNGASRYWPANWDKLGSDQTVTVNSFSCGDGYVYAWDNIWNDDNYATISCRWYNDDPNWQNDCGNFRSYAGAIQNNSAHGNSVNLYFHPDYTGAWACLGSGSVWRDLRYNYFSWGAGLDGYGQALNNEVASSKWVRSC
jgi:hypothetical protein